MPDNLYEQIVALRDLKDAAGRGYRFEQLMREIHPWSYRPPIVESTKHEQLDAFFEWNSWFFLIEAKAKADPIQRGSSDWEDFELKIRRRRGSCVGLFCCLNQVNKGVIEAAEELNREGMSTLILQGWLWDDLADNPIPFADVLRYMVSHARSVQKAEPPPIKEIANWLYDREQIRRSIQNQSLNKSATFLRRYKLARHAELYVRRTIDHRLEEFIADLKPSRIASLRKLRTKDGTEFETARQLPDQIAVVRDKSGAGKTTLAVNLILNAKDYFGIGMAASEHDLDTSVSNVLAGIGEANGIQRLIAVDRPLMVVIDSLDEAVGQINKGHEIRGILRMVKELNELGEQYKMLSFPIGFIFTVREEYWRDWESLFEGQKSRTYLKSFSEFTPPELEEAIQRYGTTYTFSPTTALSEESRRVLAIPFNLSVFSEANEFAGDISLHDVLEEDVLHLYFSRKKDDLSKRGLQGVSNSQLMEIIADLAYKVTLQGQNTLTKQTLFQCIQDVIHTASVLVDDIRVALVSEQILLQDDIEQVKFRFRHMRFVEYLLAWYIARTVHITGDTTFLESFTEQIFNSGIVSMYRVHDFVRHICTKEFHEALESIQDYYSTHQRYMKGTLLQLRNGLALGEVTEKVDNDLILQKVDSSSPVIAWDGFFIVAAKPNGLTEGEILYAFEVAWKANGDRSDRWKLLDRIASRGMIFGSGVLERILSSTHAKEWEVYLGFVAAGDSTMRKRFLNLWEEVGGENAKRMLDARDKAEWRTVLQLLQVIMRGDDYVPGLQN
jgi:hypothetical protein